MRAYVSSLRRNTTTSPLHRYAAENGRFEDGWAIVPLKHVTYLRSLHPNTLTEQEQGAFTAPETLRFATARGNAPAP